MHNSTVVFLLLSTTAFTNNKWPSTMHQNYYIVYTHQEDIEKTHLNIWGEVCDSFLVSSLLKMVIHPLKQHLFRSQTQQLFQILSRIYTGHEISTKLMLKWKKKERSKMSIEREGERESRPYCHQAAQPTGASFWGSDRPTVVSKMRSGKCKVSKPMKNNTRSLLQIRLIISW